MNDDNESVAAPAPPLLVSLNCRGNKGAQHSRTLAGERKRPQVRSRSLTSAAVDEIRHITFGGRQSSSQAHLSVLRLADEARPANWAARLTALRRPRSHDSNELEADQMPVSWKKSIDDRWSPFRE